MKGLFMNWKTTASGVALVLVSAANTFGFAIPGLTPPDLGTAIMMAVGLIFASDASKK